MRLINTKAHGIYDYLMGALLIMSPNFFHYADGGISQKISTMVGVSLWVSGAFTNYEFGILKLLNLKLHLAFDLAIGLLLASSAILLHEGNAFKSHLVFGLSITAVSFLTDRVLTREVRILMKKDKTKLRPSPPVSPAKMELPTIPGLKLILDPFETIALKTLRKGSALIKTKF